MKKTLVSILFLMCAGAQAQTSAPRLATATAMGQKVGALPATVEICKKHTPQQKAELKQVLAQLDNRFATVQGQVFVESYRQGFKNAETAAYASAEKFKKTMPQKDFDATCDKFVAQYPNTLAGLRRLAERR